MRCLSIELYVYLYSGRVTYILYIVSCTRTMNSLQMDNSLFRLLFLDLRRAVWLNRQEFRSVVGYEPDASPRRIGEELCNANQLEPDLRSI